MNLHLPQLPPDKAMHILYGMAAAIVGAYGAPLAAAHLPLLAWALPWHGALIAAAAAGAGKELLDKTSGSGEPSVLDAAATVAGGAAIALATVL